MEFETARDATSEQVTRFGLDPEPGVRYLMMTCGCQNEVLIECRGGQGQVRTYKSECPFCHGPLDFKTEFAGVDFHFDY